MAGLAWQGPPGRWAFARGALGPTLGILGLRAAWSVGGGPAGALGPGGDGRRAALIVVDPLTGARRMWYSHSRGAAQRWMANPSGYGVTFGILELGDRLETPPTYVGELGLWDEQGAPQVMFSRDQDYLEDGSLLLMDAGCQNLCPHKGVIYHVDRRVAALEPTGQSGVYTPDFHEQRMVDIQDDAILDVYRCGLGALFAMEWVPSQELGRALTAASRDAFEPCPAE